jgi:hypothetical protein
LNITGNFNAIEVHVHGQIKVLEVGIKNSKNPYSGQSIGYLFE